MRDIFLEEVYRIMKREDIFFLSDDFGSPVLDQLRRDFPERFVNVGIAEQNLINLAAGLALEGWTVYAYGIAAFLSMRAYEQVRVNLAMLSQWRDINVNLVAVGAGVSYDVSGPSHHCLEDLGLMRMLPNMTVFSPSDGILCEEIADYTAKASGPKYIRLDGKALPNLYKGIGAEELKCGFSEIRRGEKLCIVATGYMTHRALAACESLKSEIIDVGVIDVFLLKPFDEGKLFETLERYDGIVTLEEGFVNKGGLDGLISSLLEKNGSRKSLAALGFKDAYTFDVGNREYLHRLNQLDEESILRTIKSMLD
ncbi:MAG: transketolase [Candidatus Hydrogenedentota bacterium]|nr:MAG: transketolase [Candidatus Hydrogenedentota bacterium]